MKKIILSILFFLFTFTAWARSQSGGSDFFFSPVIGVESVKQLAPTETTSTRMLYGVEIFYRLPITTAELEYTHAQNTVTDSISGTSYKFVDDKIRFGFREHAWLAPFVSSYVRAGAQLSASKETQNATAGIQTANTRTLVNPYLGVGLGLHLSHYFSISGNLTCVYVPQLSPTQSSFQLEPSVGIGIGF